MLKASEILDRYYLDVRCMLLEIAGTLDRHDRAGGTPGREDPRLATVYRALEILTDRRAGPGRAERLLNLFSDPVA